MMDFVARKGNLTPMLDYVRQQAMAAGLDAIALHKLELAAEEAIVNIISYAYSYEAGKVMIDCRTDSHVKFIVTIRDRGKPFNPLEKTLDIQTDKPIGMRKIGGLGIFLIRKVLDEVSYQREGEENVLQMVIRK